MRHPSEGTLPTAQLSGAVELHLAMTEIVMRELFGVLLPPDESRAPERGLIGVLHVSRGRRRRTLLLRRIVKPEMGEVTFDDEHGLLFSARYKSRAADIAASERAGLAFVHTHPAWPGRKASFPRPSPEDLESDPRDLFSLGSSLVAGAPLAAAIVSDTGHWSIREYSFQFPTNREEVNDTRFTAAAGRMTYASAVRVIGPSLRKLPTNIAASGPAGAEGAIAVDAQDSSVRLWGEPGQKLLASLRVGHVGAGGVGSILAEHSARLGIGEAVFLDYDRLSIENFNRSQGATREEALARAPKVLVAERLARASATAPQFSASAIVGSIVEVQSIPDLLDCDLILNGADSPWGRQVLDHLAFAHLIPVVQGGTQLNGDPTTGRLLSGKAEVSATGPGNPCSECAGVYTRGEVTEAQEDPNARGRRRYVSLSGGVQSALVPPRPDELRAPSVIAFNALVAGLMQLRLLAIALGTTPEALVGAQRYHVLEGGMDWAVTKTCKQNCPRPSTTALGDDCQLPTGEDLDFAQMRASLLSPSSPNGGRHGPANGQQHASTTAHDL
jgi:hypothetical protein